jgi:hypothetical protein
VAGRIDGVRPVAEIVQATIGEFYETIGALREKYPADPAR